MEARIWQTGLSAATAVSCFGKYREGAGEETFAFPTVAHRGGEFFLPNPAGKRLWNHELPLSYAVAEKDHGWTGKRVEYRYGENGADGFDLEIRSTLPAPLYRLKGRSFRLRWVPKNEPHFITGLESGRKWMPAGVDASGEERFFHLESRHIPTLLVTSQPLVGIRIISHMHYELVFAEAGAAFFVCPIYRAEDFPVTDEARALWTDLLTAPPLTCEERFAFADGKLHLEQTFPGAKVSPQPPFAALLDGFDGFLEKPQAATLLHGVLGSYRVSPGHKTQLAIASDWINATITPQATIPDGADLTPIPDELAYAGDYTWDPASPMDQLLSLRTWAPLLKLIPEPRRSELIGQLGLPTASDFRASLTLVEEPVSGLVWTKEAKLFEHMGDVSYDPDWYNGLSLSGLERATVCGDPKLEGDAKALAADIRNERALMANYYAIFHDWAICAAWMDPRGWAVNADCIHNGMEGMLAEARLRDAEGNASGADWLRYLAVKTGLHLIACTVWPHYTRDFDPTRLDGLPKSDDATELFGINGAASFMGFAPITAATKNPYNLAGHFPELAALLKTHTDLSKLRRLLDSWEHDHPERYANWVTFYVGEGYAEAFANSFDQEKRVQAAVFYHLAPEVSTRLWVFDEPAESIGKRFTKPRINLAEELLLLADMRLEM